MTNALCNNVTKLRVSVGTNLGTFTNLIGGAFDGANILVANESSKTVSKL